MAGEQHGLQPLLVYQNTHTKKKKETHILGYGESNSAKHLFSKIVTLKFQLSLNSTTHFFIFHFYQIHILERGGVVVGGHTHKIRKKKNGKSDSDKNFQLQGGKKNSSSPMHWETGFPISTPSVNKSKCRRNLHAHNNKMTFKKKILAFKILIFNPNSHHSSDKEGGGGKNLKM